MKAQWQTAAGRATLLKTLVGHKSITRSKGEQTFPYLIQQQLMSLDYFQAHPNHIHFVPTDDARHAVIAYYQASSSNEAVTLISHFDTVGVEDFGPYQPYAFDMDRLTALFQQDKIDDDPELQADIVSGQYLFGRGSMDMKAGLMLHLSLIEKAILEQWDVNLILITVPDEEVNSKGMHAAVAYLEKLRQTHQFEIKLHLNSKPTFQQQGNSTHYFYTGSVGKIMPGALVYGRETHVGLPTLGLSSNFVMSYILQEIEYHFRFKETFEGETTPLPVTLKFQDLKQQYDVQTPFRTVALFNIFLFQQHADEIFEQFNAAVQDGINKAYQVYHRHMQQEGITHPLKLEMMTYEQLAAHARQHYGSTAVENIINHAIQEAIEPHEQTIRIVDELMQLCHTLGPTVVTFFAPPYYPATNASYHPLIESISHTLKETAMGQFNRITERIHYFNGISDLSYVSPSPNGSGFTAFRNNTPVFGRSYHIPFKEIERIQAPFLNCGPIGKDAHKITERIHQKSAFEELPVLLATLIQRHFLNTHNE